MREKEEREKVNRERAKKGKSPLPSPETMAEPDSSPSGSGNVDYSMYPTLTRKGTGGQSPGQRRAGIEPPAQAVGGSTRTRTTDERMPVRPDVETLGRVSPPRHQVGPSAGPIGHSTGTSGSARAPRSGSKKRKLITVSG